MRPDRQTLLFSATFKKKVEKLARDVLSDPVRIIHGEEGGEANEDIEQKMILMLPTNKLPWLIAHLVQFTSVGSVLVFVTKKVSLYFELCVNCTVILKILNLSFSGANAVDPGMNCLSEAHLRTREKILFTVAWCLKLMQKKICLEKKERCDMNSLVVVASPSNPLHMNGWRVSGSVG